MQIILSQGTLYEDIALDTGICMRQKLCQTNKGCEGSGLKELG